MASLVDTNVLVYRFDTRFPEKQARATELLRAGLIGGGLAIPHQAIVELVSVVTSARTGPLLSLDEAVREAEELLVTFPVLYPDEGLVRLALRGMATYGLPWFDAHLWAYAERFGAHVLYSEDLQHDRLYGGVRVIDPFR